MNILYGIQGTGHGHISRAREILPALSNQANVDVLVSGYNCKLKINDVQVTHKRGISFAYDNNGGVSYLQTALQLNPVRFLKDIQHLDIHQYDLIISDFEPITAWAAIKKGKQCIGLSHQAAFLSAQSPRPPKQSILAELIIKRFAPSNNHIGFHFLKYDTFVEGPVIRSQVQRLSPSQGEHITVYLPAFDHETLVSIFSQCRETEWHVFSPYCDSSYQKWNVRVHPVGNEAFLNSLESSLGVITSAGFETCAESLYLGKKLMIVPIKNQYEQLCNAAALGKMGVPVASGMGFHFIDEIKQWLKQSHTVSLPEIADTNDIIRKLMCFAEKYSSPES